LGTTVAVKVLKDMSQVSLGDFRTELNTLQKVSLANMCTRVSIHTRVCIKKKMKQHGRRGGERTAQSSALCTQKYPMDMYRNRVGRQQG
jgi:hypothetical protein